MTVGSLIEIGNRQHVIVDKFWVGFADENARDVQREYYYEIFSMDDSNGKRKRAITVQDFAEGVEKGNIRLLSAAREP